MPDKDTIARLAALYEAATPGEWTFSPDAECTEDDPALHTMNAKHSPGRKSPVVICSPYWDDADFHLIAHAHNLMPKILDVLRAGELVAHKLSDLQPGDKLYTRDIELLNGFGDALDALQKGGE